MGKVRSKKCSKIARSDPTGLEKVGEGEDLDVCGDLGPVSVFVQTILEQLRSHLAEERDSGLNSLSSASSKPAYLEEILKSDILRTVGPLLLDQSVSVRHSAAGTLRNFSSISMEVCERMIASDVLTPVVALIKQKYCGDWLPQSKEKKSQQPFKIDSATEAFIETVSLLWNLCEAGEIVVKIFNKEKLGDMLTRFLNHETYSLRVSICTALCLYSATEDNSEAVSNPSQLEELLMKIFMVSDQPSDDWQLQYFKTAATGIFVNLYKGDLRQMNPDTIALIMKMLNAPLNIDHLKEVNKFSSEVPLTNGEHVEVYHRGTESDLKKIFELDEKCETMMALVSSQVMALEILSNIIISDDDQWDEQGSVSGESVEDFQDTEDMVNEEDVEMKDINSDIPSEVYESLSSSGTVAKVLNKIKSLPVNVGQILQEDETHGQKLLRKCIILKSTALICLQNLVEVLEMSDLEKCINIIELWNGLESILSECGPSDITMIEAITSAMRALIQAVASQKSRPSTMNGIFISPVFQKVYDAVSLPKIQINIIKITASIGILTTSGSGEGSNTEECVRQIASQLLSCVSAIKLEREGLWLAAEIFDSLFDVFAEDDYNHILKQVGLIPKLKALQPAFKRQVRSERRSLGENAAVIQTANTNLPRFIQYKEKHGA